MFYGNKPTHAHLFTDNQAAEHIATRPTMNEHSRSINTRHHAVRQDYIKGKVQIGGVKTTENPNDILTKFLPAPAHMKHKFYTHPLQDNISHKDTTTPQCNNNMHAKWQFHLSTFSSTMKSPANPLPECWGETPNQARDEVASHCRRTAACTIMGSQTRAYPSYGHGLSSTPVSFHYKNKQKDKTRNNAKDIVTIITIFSIYTPICHHPKSQSKAYLPKLEPGS
jgi:hypothetical protein